VSEAEQIYGKMIELGRPAWYAVANNEGHGFQKKENTDLIAVLYSHFFMEQLLK
jgi:dipeptidyl aminopeptidase/acylaminoacyl peptidase